MRPELQVHLVEALGQPPPEGVVCVAERRAEVADDAAALVLLAAANHLLNRVQSPEHRLERVILVRWRQVFLDFLQQLPTLLHVAVDHGEAQLLLAAEVVEEGPRRHLRRLQDLLQLGIVVALQGEQARRLPQDLLPRLHRPRLPDGPHRRLQKTE